MSGRRGASQRDTAKDVILGLPPSGAGPRAPREGRMGQGGQSPGRNRPQPPPSPQSTRKPEPSVRPSIQEQRKGPPVAPVQPIPQPQDHYYAPPRGGNGNDKVLLEELARLQQQMRNFQRQSDDALRAEQEARRRLEASLKANNDNMARMGDKVRNTEGVSGQQARKQDIDDLRQKVSGLEAVILRMQQDIGHLKGAIDRHSGDMMMLNNEVKNRPQVDPNKSAGQAQQMDGRLRELHGGLMQMRQNLDNEMNERRRADQEHGQNMQRLQAIIQDQDARKNQILQQLAAEGQGSKAKMDEEARRLNDKIAIITDQVTRNLMDNEQRLRDENNQKYLTLEKAIKAELDARLQYERDIRAFLEERWRTFGSDLEECRATQAGDKSKNKEKFQKVNEALAVMERHLEQGNKKVDRVVAAEINTRKLHEKGLLTKLTDIEERLASYLGGMNQAIDDVKRGKQAKPPPNLDTDGIRREMEAVATDKHKLSMEGLLKLEEKMQRIERGLDRDSKELKDRLEDAADGSKGDAESLAKLRQQLKKLDEMQEDIERSHTRLKDKVERQLPQDLDELSAKLDNAKHQLHDRVDKEENERYLAIREVQEELNKLKHSRPAAGPAPAYNPGPSAAPEAAAEHQIAIKKLAESVTTVKNVLDRKLNDEIRTRERETQKLEEAIQQLRGGGKKK